LALVSEITARDLRNRTRRTENWSPAARLLAGAAGSALAVYGSTLGAGLGAAGLLLTTRAITNADFTHLASQATKQLHLGGGNAANTNIQPAA
jgi:hypothetical protein